MLLKSRKDIVEVEKCRTIRVEENLKKKREEKGLITVQETMNESDANRTGANMTPSTTNILKNVGMTREVIQEESFSDKEDSRSRSS